MKPKFTTPELYEPPGPINADKDWYVEFYYEHPITGKRERFRYGFGFGQYNSKVLRREHGKAMITIIEDLLQAGWSPFDEFNPHLGVTNSDRNVIMCIDRYLEEIKSMTRRNTYLKYTTELRSFQKWLLKSGYQSLQMNEVKKAIVVNFLTSHKVERKWSGKTYNNYLNDITTFFNYFHSNYDDIIDKVPTISLKRSPVERKGNLAYNDWQFKRLKDLMLENNDHFLYTFCSFIYYAALRNEAEATFIKVGDFNFNTKTLRVDSGNAKNRRTEYIPIYPDFMDLLIELRIPELPSDYYIFGKNSRQSFVIGGPMHVGQDLFARRFRKYKKILNLSERHGIYCYKHTRAVHLGEDGEDLYKIMKLFRHKDLATTMVYMKDLGINTQNTEFKKGRKF